MANRTVYGNAWSENGWPMVDQNSCTWVTVPGTNVNLQIQNGLPLAILRAFAADFNAYVEPLRDADSACWTSTNSVSTSNHLSGTALDLNWNSHPFLILNAGFSEAKIAVVRELIDFYEGTIFWGNDWNTPKDAMHFQVGYGTYGKQSTADFVARKIRADGFSTFRRGSTPSGADVLSRATGLSQTRSAEILGAVRAGLVASECFSVKRIAMWLAQVGHESDSFNATEEYAKNGRYAPYIGRTWIQITWDYNYRSFGEWCYERGLIRSQNYFVDHPADLARMEFAGIGPAWYWTVERPTLNALSDAGNLNEVTLLINGGYNGLGDRRIRYNRALGLGDALLSLIRDTAIPHEPTLEELLMADTLYPSVSLYKTPGEGAKYTLAQLIQSIDGMLHSRTVVENDAKLGDLDALDRIFRVAAGSGEYTDNASVNHAKAFLAKLEDENKAIIQNYLSAKGIA